MIRFQIQDCPALVWPCHHHLRTRSPTRAHEQDIERLIAWCSEVNAAAIDAVLRAPPEPEIRARDGAAAVPGGAGDAGGRFEHQVDRLTV